MEDLESEALKGVFRAAASAVCFTFNALSWICLYFRSWPGLGLDKISLCPGLVRQGLHLGRQPGAIRRLAGIYRPQTLPRIPLRHFVLLASQDAQPRRFHHHLSPGRRH